MTVEIVYLGNDNTFTRQLLSDGVAVDLSSVTRVTIKLDKVYDSDDVGEGDDLVEGLGIGEGDGMDTSTGSGKIIFRLGDQSIPAGTYLAEITIYDDSNTDGIVFPTFYVTAKA